MEWNWLTIAVAGVFLLGFLIGIYRGAIRIAVSLATTILTIVIAAADNAGAELGAADAKALQGLSHSQADYLVLITSS